MKITDLSNLNIKNSQEISIKKKLNNVADKKIEDEYRKSSSEESNGYNNLKLNNDENMISDIIAEADKARSLIQDLIAGMLNRQLGISKDSEIFKDELFDKFQERIRAGGDKNFTIDEIARKEAEALLGPGGEWSPEKVSGRIVDFSIAIFGGDKSKIGIIRDAVNRGFGEAEKAWGSPLPDITNETKELINEKLDKWVNNEPEKEII